jgi:hypothetical protein
MYPTTTPNISDGTDNHVYDVVAIGSYNCVRREAGAALDQPATLTVSHQHTGSGLSSKTRSLVRFDRVVEDGDGNQATQSAYLVVETPTKISSDASIKKTITELTSFLAISGYVDKLLNEEI